LELLHFFIPCPVLFLSHFRLRAKEKDLALAEEKVLAAESQITELQARLNDTVNQRRHWEDEYNVCYFSHEAYFKF
jgi:hypothetical protein